tara:strand:+ start:301 stop:1203 length:903 start_codon:yes stop_codon:yes gene_type:complete
MSSTMFINGTTFNPDQDIKYGKAKVNARGMKTVPINNAKSGYQLQLSVPLMLTWGVNVRENDDGRKTYDMSLQFPRSDYSNDRTDAFLRAMECVEEKVRKDATNSIYSKEWFNKPKLTDAQVDVLFNNMLYRPKDRDTGELREDASPSLRVKIDCYDGEFKCEIYDMKETSLYPNADSNVSPIDLITKGSNVACIIRCSGIYFVNGKFGVTWRLVQAVVKPRASLQGRCHIKLCDEEVESLENQKEEEEEEQEDLSDNEEMPLQEQEQEQQEPEQEEEEEPEPVVEVKPKKKKVVRKKKA